MLQRKSMLKRRVGLGGVKTVSIPTIRQKKSLRIEGHSTSAELKREIQAILREIVILRDGGCFLRHFHHRTRRVCGGWRNDGKLILQAEHLHTRANAASFADSRLVVCICRDHHIFWKPQHSAEYNQLAGEFIGKDKTALWHRIRSDRGIHKVDLKLELLALKGELKKLLTARPTTVTEKQN